MYAVTDKAYLLMIDPIIKPEPVERIRNNFLVLKRKSFGSYMAICIWLIHFFVQRVTLSNTMFLQNYNIANPVELLKMWQELREI